jgi:hypothetical protein
MILQGLGMDDGVRFLSYQAHCLADQVGYFVSEFDLCFKRFIPDPLLEDKRQGRHGRITYPFGQWYAGETPARKWKSIGFCLLSAHLERGYNRASKE